MVLCVNVLTAFPDFFPGVLSASLAGKALKKGIWDMNIFDIRAFAKDARASIDDTPYGGGRGMLLSPDAIGKAIDYITEKQQKTKLIYMSPVGEMLTQKLANDIIMNENITVLCGHFEGVDQRVLDFFDFFTISIGDYVLSGGEIAAMVFLDACIRLLPGVAGNSESIRNDSFSNGLALEYPHYTRPRVWRDVSVPDVLLSGNHEKIREWREQKSLERTRLLRPNLLHCEENEIYG